MRRAKQGWMLLEVMFAVGCLALVLSYVQHQQSQIDQTLNQVLDAHAKARQTQLQNSVKRVFKQTVRTTPSITSAPDCQSCRGAQLTRLLQYEVSQW